MSRPNRNKEQVMFSVDIKQRGARVTGSYWFGQLVNGENDGGDSSFVPFVGTVKGGGVVTIEFDPNDTHGIDEENVRYRRPRSPATATLKLVGGKLEWALTKGKLNTGDLVVPATLTMRRSR